MAFIAVYLLFSSSQSTAEIAKVYKSEGYNYTATQRQLPVLKIEPDKWNT